MDAHHDSEHADPLAHRERAGDAIAGHRETVDRPQAATASRGASAGAGRTTEAQSVLRDRAIHAVTHGIVITDVRQADNPIVYVNAGFEAMTGYSAGDVIGRNCRFLQGPDTDPKSVRSLRDAVASGSACSVELLNYRRHGEPFWNALAITPVRDDEGRVCQFIGVQVDVTERRRLERSLQVAQRMEAVGRLAGGVAHDFNNLLTAIRGSSDVLQAALPIGDPLREVARDIAEATARAVMLTHQLLSFGRRQALAVQVLDVTRLVHETVAMLRRVIGEDIVVRVENPGSAVYVRADRALFEQVLVNLALNARDAMPDGGSLTIRTERVLIDDAYRSAHNDVTDLYHASQREMRSGAYILLTMSDTGVGMDATTVARVFEPFFTTKGPGQGTGLGLAMVYGVVQQSDGYITVSSEPGRGSAFRIFLPAVSPEAGDANPGTPSGRTASETILLVEDDERVRGFAKRVLGARGHRILDAADGLDALRVAADYDGHIDLLLTDVVMPNMGGRALAEALRQTHPATRVLFMSGYPDDEVLRRGIQQDRNAFLAKPFTQVELAAKVRAVLDAPIAPRGA